MYEERFKNRILNKNSVKLFLHYGYSYKNMRYTDKEREIF